jgi:hypothetical protein
MLKDQVAEEKPAKQTDKKGAEARGGVMSRAKRGKCLKKP